jgi:ornithine cyclodeaminase/alanine dehydrogenase
VDIFKQCAVAGELHHGLESGMITKDVVHAEIGQIVAGKKPGRETPTEIIVYDATGTALQDTAAVALCYEKAMEKGIGQFVDFLK